MLRGPAIKYVRAPARTLGFALLAALVFSVQAGAQEPKPLLSDEIGKVIEAEGVEAAQARFDEIFPDRADQYQVDAEGFSGLAVQRMTAGDTAGAEALMGMFMTISQSELGALMPEIAAAVEAEQRSRDRAQAGAEGTAEASGPGARGGAGPGPARDDLRRFRGLYGEPGQVPPRDLFVVETCDGYLVAGPMWADVAPWHLTSVGDDRFEYADSFTSVELTFRTEDGGRALSLGHTVEGLASPLPHRGPLPSEWGDDCLNVERGG